MITGRKDFLQQPIKLGDKVVYSTGQYSDISSGYVIGFTPKKIRIGKNPQDERHYTTKYDYTVCVIIKLREKEEATQH